MQPGLLLAGQLGAAVVVCWAGGRARVTGLAAVQRGEHLCLWLVVLCLGVLWIPGSSSALAAFTALWLLCSLGREPAGRPDRLSLRGILWLALFVLPLFLVEPGIGHALAGLALLGAILALLVWLVLRPPPARLRKAVRRRGPGLA